MSFDLSDYESCIYPKEKTLYRVSLAISIIVWGWFLLLTLWVGLIPVLLGALFFTATHALFIARIKGHGLRVSEKQYPKMYELAKNACNQLGLGRVPEIYIVNMDGIFNAFASRLFSRDFVIISTSLLDSCEQDAAKIGFIIAHEIAHLERKHPQKQLLLLPANLIPWLSMAYSRAREYTCDALAAKMVLCDKDQALRAVLVLPTADKQRADAVNLEAYEEQRRESTGFWMTIVATNATHPFWFDRVANIRKIFGEDIPKIRRSFFGKILAPLMSFWAVILIYFIIISVTAFDSYEKNVKQAQIMKNSTTNTSNTSYDSSSSDEYEDAADTVPTPVLRKNNARRTSN